MRILRLLICISSFTLALSQQHSPSSKSPHPYNFAPSSQRTRRLQGGVEQKRVSLNHYSGPRNSPTSRKHNSKKNGVPSYAVQMEPLVQYSQPDPLYTIEKQYISEAKPLDSSSNDLVKKDTPGPMVADITEAESISRVGQITHARFRPPTHLSPPPPARPHHHHHHHHHPMKEVEFSSYGTYYEGPPEAFEAPEPIIEIIIRESNESLPAPPPLPTPPPPKKTKEPVQVFYVKYKKEPGSGYGGEDKIIYDAPVPAVTPPSNEEHHEEHHEPEPIVENVPEEVTNPPPPSTTLKAIIRPDSETFDAKGVHITFGAPEESDQDHDHHHQQSAPQPAIALPNRTPKPSISRSSNGGVSTLKKRNPEPFNGPPSFQPNFPQPSAPTTFQQTPQFPPEDFQPPPLDSSQYSTLPQNLQFQRSQQQRYTTINNPPPSHQQYHTINLPPHNAPSPGFQPFPQQQQQQNSQHFQPQRPSVAQDQHQRQVEQVNRLQQQQQLLQQQISQQHRFQQQPFPQQPPQQPQFPQQPPQQPQFPQQPPQQPQFPQAQPQFVQQPSQQQPQSQFFQQPSQQNQQFQPNPSQVLPQQQFAQQTQYRQPPQLQYNQNPDIVKSLEQSSNMQNHRHEAVSTFAPTPPPPPPRVPSPTSPVPQYRSTTTTTTTTESVTEIVTEDPQTIEKKKKQKDAQVQKNVANLPDEVPDDLREQLLSSGILGNADIQILDYDKIGDIPIENLPPEALANFQQATSGSQRVTVIRKPDSAQDREDEDSASSSSEYRPVTFSSANSEEDMEMKVVRFNPDEGENVADRYMKKGATQLAPVVLNDNKYNRYLPLQVSGAQFPVPDVPELRGRNVTSVVVLAPVDYEFLNRRDDSGDSDARVGRSAAPVLEVQGVHFIAGDVLKTLVRMPSTENYRRWLEKENKTAADKQSVVLLVLEPDSDHPDKEIYMYDISSGRVSKLRGELSSTFVQVAASNSHNQDLEEIADNPVAPGGDFSGSIVSRLPPR